MNEWISVEDRLPDKDSEVLVTDGKKVWVKQFIATPDSLCAFTKPCFCYWDDSSRDGYYVKTRQVITHWMPLPPPPTDNKDE